MTSMRAGILMLLATALAASGCAEPPEASPSPEPATSRAALARPPVARILKDVNPNVPSIDDGESEPKLHTALGDTVYFTAWTALAGRELWKTDGTANGTVLIKDIVPGAGSPDIERLIVVGNVLFFTATEPATGRELWKTDGTEAGTVLVKELVPGSQGPTFSSFAAAGGTLFFAADDKVRGTELWKSDGTAAGTVLVKDLYPGSGSGSPSSLTALGGMVIFTADASGYGNELWKSDGTEAGTVLLKDLYPGYSSSYAYDLVAAGGRVYFQASDGVTGTEPWTTDGTAAGTVRLADINPGSSGSSPRSFTQAGGNVFFYASDPASGIELWKTDGTPAGTARVADINPGSASASPRDLVAVGSTLFFTATEPATGRELWKTDGTPAGTVLVADLTAGTSSTSLWMLTAFNGRLYFDASSCLWVSDGTAAGTRAVRNLYIYESRLTAASSYLFFNATYNSNREPWRSDGTPEGTYELKDLQPRRTSSLPGPFVASGSHVFFFGAAQGASRYSLYRTDGSEAGTTEVGDTNLYNMYSLKPLFAHNGSVFFPGFISGYDNEPWRSDGTLAGTGMVKDLYPGSYKSSDPEEFTSMGGAVYFEARDALGGRELWKSDGTEAGTVLVKDIYPGTSSGAPSSLVVMNGVLYFAAQDSAAGNELWRSDGTAEGTVRVKDLYPGTPSSYPSKLTVAGNTLYFVASTNSAGYELWKSDGTAAGTVLVKDIRPGYSDSGIESLTAVGNTVFFLATEGTSGFELWKSDGTAAGTVRVKDIYPGPGSANPRFLTAVNQQLFFGASTAAEGYELWVSDGTEAGTVLVKDFLPGPASGLAAAPMAALGPENLVVFTATDGLSGMEPWVSAGTARSTELLEDLVPGAGSSVPSNYVRAGSLLYFHAEDGTRGREPWVYPLSVIRDTTPPTVTCPGPVVAEALGPDGAAVSYPPATATDDSVIAPPTLSYSHASGSLFPLGTTSVTVTATDANGNRATCAFTITVRDTSAPTLTCPVEVTAEASGPGGAQVTYAPATASDATSTPVLTYSHPSGATFPVGTTPVLVTATDGAGLQATCTFQVKVVDTTAPSLACPAPVVAEATSPAGAAVGYVPAAAWDAVTPTPTVAHDRAPGSVFPLGLTTVTATAVDTAGNRASCSFTITVRDSAPPSLSCPATVSAQATSSAGATVRYPPATASDAISRVTLAYSRPTGATFPLGITPVTVTATDGSGNVAQCSFAVSVQDTLPPSVSCPASVTAEATGPHTTPVTYPAATVSDGVTASPSVVYSHASGSAFPLGINVVTVAATDGAGNSSSCAFTVTVRDTTAPTLVCPVNVTAEALDARGRPVTYPAPTVLDAVTATPTVVYSKDSGSTFLVGSSRVTVMASDEAGNAAVCSFYVTVRDTTAPTLSCPANVIAEATGSTGAPVSFGPTAVSDAVTLSPTLKYSPASGSVFPLGSTAVTASATDGAGNVAQCTFTVTVRDTQAPALTCPADITLQSASASGTRVTYPPATFSDGVSSAGLTYSHPPGSLFPQGTTPVTATATDGAGNRSTCVFHITVHDRSLPALTCPASLAAEAADASGAVVTYPPGTVVHPFPVTLSASQESGTRFPLGTTAVTVTATDASGDSALCTFTVTVRDTTAPAITCPSSLTVRALGPDGAAVAYPDATASDAVTLAPALSWSQVSGSLFPVGTTPVSAVARDGAGNSATCSFDVVVQPPL